MSPSLVLEAGVRDQDEGEDEDEDEDENILICFTYRILITCLPKFSSSQR